MEGKQILGLVLFKRVDDEHNKVVRVIKVKDASDPLYTEVTLKDLDTKEVEKVGIKELEDYSPLEPHGIFTASIVSLHSKEDKPIKDVIVAANKYYDTRAGFLPYVVCRQGATDIFASMFNPEKELVGLSVNRETCPAGFDMKQLFYADNIDFHILVNFYRDDTVEDILDLLPKFRFNEVLTNLYMEHIKYTENPSAIMKDEDGGWCKSIDLLLKQNNFQSDINQMFGIFDVDFDMRAYIQYKPIPGNEDVEYGYIQDDMRYWLSSVYKVNIKEANVIEFGYDIDLADYKNNKYLLIRDNTSTLYLVVYTSEGEYLAADIEAKAKEMDFSTKFKVNFYNKYRTNNDSIAQD